MKKDMLIRAWTGPAFQAGLPAEARAARFECPAGLRLSDLDEGCLAVVVGGGPQPDPWIGPGVLDDPEPSPWRSFDPNPQPWFRSYDRFARRVL